MNSQKGRPEGVFSGGSNEEPLFYEALELDMPDIEAVQEKTHHRILRWLAHHGYLDPEVRAGPGLTGGAPVSRKNNLAPSATLFIITLCFQAARTVNRAIRSGAELSSNLTVGSSLKTNPLIM